MVSSNRIVVTTNLNQTTAGANDPETTCAVLALVMRQQCGGGGATLWRSRPRAQAEFSPCDYDPDRRRQEAALSHFLLPLSRKFKAIVEFRRSEWSSPIVKRTVNATADRHEVALLHRVVRKDFHRAVTS